MGHLLTQLLTETAGRRPAATACTFEGRRISYEELDTLTNRVAHALVEGGVRRGDRVAIYVEKSIESLVSVYGILKAGAAYVPLDPGSPHRRLAHIVRDCGVRCVVTSGEKAAELPTIISDESGHLLDLAVILGPDGGAAPARRVMRADDIASMPARELPTGKAGDLAYILYTSGSTGTPKGVMISHVNALAFVDWAVDTFRVSESDVLSNHAPLHFDLSIFDIFGACKAGATVALIPQGMSMFPGELSAWIERNRVTVWYSVPSVLVMLLLRGQLESRNLGRLRAILFAGEVFPTKYLRRLMERLPGARFCNLYGPTETNVCTWYEVPALPAEEDVIPIGKPCAGAEVFAVDESGQRVGEHGGVGELHVRGACVMQGYWGHDLADRTYKTGDLVKLLPTGDYVFLGRKDDQVKCHGYRIEPGDVESAIHSHGAVKEVAVVAIPDADFGARLAAFVVRHDDQEAGREELSRHCRDRLPPYMLPQTFEFLSELPRTSTGKVDKLALRLRRG